MRGKRIRFVSRWARSGIDTPCGSMYRSCGHARARAPTVVSIPPVGLSCRHPGVMTVLSHASLLAGSTPYPDMTAREVMRNVHNGYRLERPSHCRSELFRVISRCWHADPDRRPEFQTLRRDLAQLLEDNMNGHYVDLESFASECTD